MIKKYSVFLPTAYKWVRLLALPIAGLILALGIFRALPILIFLPLVLSMSALIELVADVWVFGGICSKESLKLDYIKSSFYGNNVIKSGIKCDLIRKAVHTLLSAFICGLVYLYLNEIKISVNEILVTVNTGLIVYILMALILNGIRYFDSFLLYWGIGYFATGIIFVVTTIYISFKNTGYITLVLNVVITVGLVVLAFLSSILHIKHVMYRVEKSYCDGE